MLNLLRRLAPLCMLICAMISHPANADAIADDCLLDLNSLPDFLLENDTGAPAHLQKYGQAHFDQALATARTAAAQSNDPASCTAVIRRYLQAWRNGHLDINDIPNAASSTPAHPAEERPTGSAVASAPRISPDLRAPALSFPSAYTAVLTVHSFSPAVAAPLADLLKQNHDALAQHPYWIIDVRDNNGGSDSVYSPLMHWLAQDEIVSVGSDWLATPANIEAQESICASAAPNDQHCIDLLHKEAERMRAAPTHSYTAMYGQAAIVYMHIHPVKYQRPQKVAVMIDKGCASSCEQFLLAARQSFAVKLIGRPSWGALDYSNVRQHKLPSGQRVLGYAISRSARLPVFSVDIAGVQPDIYLPPPTDAKTREDEVTRVQRWLEGGTLAPQD